MSNYSQTSDLFRALSIGAASIISSSGVMAAATTIFTEGFEGAALDSRIRVETIGTFNASPGVVTTSIFGSAKAFSYGLSNCGASCFDAHMTKLIIDLGKATFISQISFKEMELLENWGSDGLIFIDGLAVGSGVHTFGRQPYNNRTPDTNFRNQIFDINTNARVIELRVTDITNRSYIALDDLSISGGQAVPEPSSLLLLIAVLPALALAGRHKARKTISEISFEA